MVHSSLEYLKGLCECLEDKGEFSSSGLVKRYVHQLDWFLVLDKRMVDCQNTLLRGEQLVEYPRYHPLFDCYDAIGHLIQEVVADWVAYSKQLMENPSPERGQALVETQTWLNQQYSNLCLQVEHLKERIGMLETDLERYKQIRECTSIHSQVLRRIYLSFCNGYGHFIASAPEDDEIGEQSSTQLMLRYESLLAHLNLVLSRITEPEDRQLNLNQHALPIEQISFVQPNSSNEALKELDLALGELIACLKENPEAFKGSLRSINVSLGWMILPEMDDGVLEQQRKEWMHERLQEHLVGDETFEPILFSGGPSEPPRVPPNDEASLSGFVVTSKKKPFP